MRQWCQINELPLWREGSLVWLTDIVRWWMWTLRGHWSHRNHIVCFPLAIRLSLFLAKDTLNNPRYWDNKIPEKLNHLPKSINFANLHFFKILIVRTIGNQWRVCLKLLKVDMPTYIDTRKQCECKDKHVDFLVSHKLPRQTWYAMIVLF